MTAKQIKDFNDKNNDLCSLLSNKINDVTGKFYAENMIVEVDPCGMFEWRKGKHEYHNENFGPLVTDMKKIGQGFSIVFYHQKMEVVMMKIRIAMMLKSGIWHIDFMNHKFQFMMDDMAQVGFYNSLNVFMNLTSNASDKKESKDFTESVKELLRLQGYEV